MTLKELTKNKSVLIGLIIVVIVILLAIFSAGGEPTQPVEEGGDTQLKKSGLQITSLTEEKKQRAIVYRQEVKDLLPVYVENFRTSVGIDTIINITALPSDALETVSLEIYGLSYVNQESDPTKNLNVKAYEESYREAMRLLRDRGIDPQKLIFTYGDRDYVQETTTIWISALKLEP